jgi:hypothetical protein
MLLKKIMMPCAVQIPAIKMEVQYDRKDQSTEAFNRNPGGNTASALTYNGRAALAAEDNYEKSRELPTRRRAASGLEKYPSLNLNPHIRNLLTFILEISLSFSLVTECWSIAALPAPGRRHALPDIFTSSKMLAQKEWYMYLAPS